MFKWVVKFIVKAANRRAKKLVQSLDKYESELQEVIAKHTDSPGSIAKAVIGFVQKKLKEIFKKIFGFFAKLFGGKLVKGLSDDVNAEIDKLDQYEDELIKVIQDFGDVGEDLAPKAVDFIQGKLNELVDKVIVLKNAEKVLASN